MPSKAERETMDLDRVATEALRSMSSLAPRAIVKEWVEKGLSHSIANSSSVSSAVVDLAGRGRKGHSCTAQLGRTGQRKQRVGVLVAVRGKRGLYQKTGFDVAGS